MQSSWDVYVWEYEGDLGGLFAPYEDKMSNYIEDAFQKDPTEQNLQLGIFDHLFSNYGLDFNRMTQTNIKRGKILYKQALDALQHQKFSLVLT